jgi:hypothetical protein
MNKKHLGSTYDDFLKRDGILEECRASAIKFKIARGLEKAMDKDRQKPKSRKPEIQMNNE